MRALCLAHLVHEGRTCAQAFVAGAGQASLRDIQKHMVTRNCIVGDVLSDLLEWGVLECTGKAMSPDTGALVGVYRPTGRLPRIEGLVEYRDLF